MGDFYEMFFDDAIKASQALDIALTKRGKHKGLDIPMCGIPHFALDSYLSKLIKKGILVAVCDQTEEKESAAKERRAVVNREITRLVTPGTLTEENLLEAREHNYLAAISCTKDSLQIGISWLDMSTGEFYHEKSDYSSIQSDLARLNPSEVLVTKQLAQDKNLSNALKNYHVTIRAEEEFGENAIKTLETHFKHFNAASLSQVEQSACGAVLSYVIETQQGKLPHLHNPKSFEASTALAIDPATRNSLELVRTLSGEKKGSVLWVMDRTVTGPGARMLASRLQAPLTNVQEIDARLDCVEFFKKNMAFIEDLRTELKKCYDMERSVQRLSLGRGSPRDLAAVGNTLEQAEIIQKMFMEQHQQLPLIIVEHLQEIGDHKELVDELQRALKPNLPPQTSDGGFIKEGYSKKLDEWISIKQNGHKMIEALLEKYRKQTGVKNLKIKDTGIIGHFVEVPTSFAQHMQQFPEFSHCQTVKNAVRYKTQELVELQDKINRAQSEALEIELAIFHELSEKVVSKADAISDCANALAALDVYSSLGLLARERNYTRPIVNESFDFKITHGRHPIVEAAQAMKGIQFVGNDCIMDKNSSILLITGPNMGGKSTYLRQNALIVIMAQMGSFVPVERAEFGVVDKLFSRVGASDNLANDQSTFMVEMVETAYILKVATKRSFVIMDEIGRGTSTLDGLSIAWSVIEYLNDVVNCRTLFATHYHELADLKTKLKRLKCYSLSVKETNGELLFTYKITAGETDKSYGVQVAKLAGIPDRVTQRAKQILQQLEKQKQKLLIH